MIRALILLAATLIASAARADTCAYLPIDALQDRLIEAEDKVLDNSGLVTGGSGIIEVWRNPATGRWSLIHILADHTACVLAEGEFWQDWHRPPPGAPI